MVLRHLLTSRRIYGLKPTWRERFGIRSAAILGGLGAAVAAAANVTAFATGNELPAHSNQGVFGINSGLVMLKVKTQIFYNERVSKVAAVVWFHQSWSLSSDYREAKMELVLQRGFLVIAHDRRGHGRLSDLSGILCGEARLS
jgi:non-heme chloroperoxidase